MAVPVHELVGYAALAVTPALALLAADRALRRWTADPGRRRGGSAAPTTSHGIERLTADLRRLERDYRRLSASDEPGRVTRLRSVTLAYDDVLRACCRCLDLPEPGDPLSALDRLQTEAALSQQGLTW